MNYNKALVEARKKSREAHMEYLLKKCYNVIQGVASKSISLHSPELHDTFDELHNFFKPEKK